MYRNVLVESARLARGNIKPIEKLIGAQHDALVIPGGFGAAKNLSDYAIRETSMSVNKEVVRVLNEFIIASKPIGLFIYLILNFIKSNYKNYFSNFS
jgi:enhancing lycopene biosynthesis protein 2